MGNINDPNDPHYSSQPGWVWEPQFGSWINTGGANAGGTNAAPPPTQPDMWQNGVQGTTSNADRNDPAGLFKGQQKPASSAGVPGSGAANYNFSVDPNVANIDQKWLGELGSMLNGVKGRKSIGMDTTQADQTRAAQTGLITDLQNQAAGIGPSLAQAQLQKASDQNLANTLSAIQSTRGMGATAAAAQAQGAGAAAGQAMAQDSAILRLQEQMQARGMLGQLATGTRGQDIGQAAQQAQIALQDRAQTDAIRDQLIGRGVSLAQAEQEARAKVAQMNQQGRIAAVGADQNQQGITNQNQQANRQQGAQESQFVAKFFMDLIKMLAGGAGGAAGAGAVTGG